MREVLEGAGEGQVVGLGGGREDVVHSWFVCKGSTAEIVVSTGCAERGSQPQQCPSQLLGQAVGHHSSWHQPSGEGSSCGFAACPH